MSAIQPLVIPQEEEKPTLKRRIPVPFFINVPANTNVCLASDQINFKYVVTNVQAHFPDDALSNLQVWAFCATNRNTPTVAPPPDNKLLGFFSPTPYLIGSGEVVDVPCYFVPSDNEKYLKVYFVNANAYAIDAYCIITIETEDLTGGGVSPVLNGELGTNLTPEQWLELAYKKSNALLRLNADVREGTSAIYAQQLRALSETNTEENKGLYDRYLNLANFVNAIPKGIPKEDILKTVAEWAFEVRDLTFEMFNNFYLADMVTGALGGKSINMGDWLEDTFGLQETVKELFSEGINTAILPQVKQYWNRAYVPLLPTQADLINMAVKEKITVEEFRTYMQNYGLSEDWSQLIWDAHFIAPDFSSVKQAYWRGAIKKKDLDNYLKRVDLDPYYNDTVWKVLLEEIPPYSELVNERVKEVITQAEFEKGLSAWGFAGKWGQRIWDAHFQPPTMDDFLTAWRRKDHVRWIAEGKPKEHKFGDDPANDISVIRQLSKLVDYDEERFWDFFSTRLYNDPTPRMARWAFEVGALTPEQVKEVVHRFGYRPEDEEWFTDMLTGFQERPFVTRYLNTAMTAYINGVWDEQKLRYAVKGANRNQAIADWIVKISDIRKEMESSKTTEEKPKLLSVAELKKACALGLMHPQLLETELRLRGYEDKDIKILTEIITTEIQEKTTGGTKKGLTTAELFDAFKYSLKTEDDVRTELMLRGMSLNEAQTLIDSKKAKWGIPQQEIYDVMREDMKLALMHLAHDKKEEAIELLRKWM